MNDGADRGRAVQVQRSGAGDPDGLIVTHGSGYEMTLDPERLDSHKFERLVAEGRTELATGRPDRAASAFDAALSLWRGAPLADLASEQFAQGEIARLEELRMTAVEDRNDAQLALGHHAELVGQLEALTKSLKTLNAELGQGGAELRALMRPLEARIEPLVAGKGESSPDADAIGEALVQLAIGIESSDRAPTAPSRQVLAECEARLSRAAAEWSAVQKEELARLNAALGAAGKKPIEIPPPDRIAGEPSGESEELP